MSHKEPHEEYPRLIQISEGDLRRIIQESVREALTLIGIEATDPVEMQKDFNHLREWRITMEDVRKKSLVAVVGIIISGIVALIIVGFKTSMKGP